METQVNFLALITSALNTYIEQQVTAALAKASPTLDETKIQALIDEAVGTKITELFEERIGELITEKMDEAIEAAIEQHTQIEAHGDIDGLVDEVTGSHAFDRAIGRAIEDAMDNHTSDYDHDELNTISDKLDDDAVDAKLEDFVPRDEIEERVAEALGSALAQTTFRLTSTQI
jgi:hypothetical protein